MSFNKRDLLIFSGIGAGIVALGSYFMFSGDNHVAQNVKLDQPEAKKSATRELDPEFEMVGGVPRRKSSLKRPVSKDTKEADLSPLFDIGTFKELKGDTNEHTKSVATAFKEKGKYPERLSPLVAPKPFNQKEFDANPAKYLNTVEPGRVFQTAQPGKDVPKLRPISHQNPTINQGEKVKLRIKAKPGSVVSFTSFDGGAFQNELNAITVQANERGIAEVDFIGTEGTAYDTNVLVGSPQNSGTVKYVVHINPPNLPGGLFGDAE